MVDEQSSGHSKTALNQMVATVVAATIWLGMLAGLIGLLSLGSLLSGIAAPFRYVGF